MIKFKNLGVGGEGGGRTDSFYCHVFSSKRDSMITETSFVAHTSVSDSWDTVTRWSHKSLPISIIPLYI